jgi:hypothetical protein
VQRAKSSLPVREGVESREGSSDSTSDTAVIRPFSGSGRGVQPSVIPCINIYLLIDPVDSFEIGIQALVF